MRTTLQIASTTPQERAPGKDSQRPQIFALLFGTGSHYIALAGSSLCLSNVGMPQHHTFPVPEFLFILVVHIQ